MHRIVPFFIWLTLLAGYFPVSGQYKLNQAVRFDVEDGLPTNDISDIKKGQDGFLWIATLDGLARFDGAQFKIYRHNPNDPYSIIDNRIQTLITTPESVWVGTPMGISILDLKTNRFKSYHFNEQGITNEIRYDRHSEIKTLYQDTQGEIWIGSRFLGPIKYAPKQDTFIYYTYRGKDHLALSPDEKGTHNVFSYTQDPKNDTIIWAGTETGLLKINKLNQSAQLYVFPLSDKLAQRQFNIFRRIHFHDDGFIYAGAWGKGLRKFNPITKQQLTLDITANYNPNILNQIWRIVRKSEHELWISNSFGLVVFNTQKEKITSWKPNNNRKGVSFNITTKDDDDRVWGSSIKGLHMFDPYLQQFEVYSYVLLNQGVWGFAFRMVEHNNQHSITVFPSDADGLFHFNKLDESWKKTSFPPQPNLPVKYHPMRDIVKAPNGKFTLASEFGLFSYDYHTNRFTPFPYQPNLKFKALRKLFWDSKGKLWVSAGIDGVFRWDPKTNEEWHYSEILKDHPAQQAVEVFHQIFEDSRSNVWMRRADGMSVYRSDQDTFFNFTHTNTPERAFSTHLSFAEDAMGRIWSLSDENWIGYTDVNQPEEGLLQKFNLSDKGLTGWASHIQADQEGQLWISTSYGLAKMNPADFTITNYSRTYYSEKPENFSFNIMPSGTFVFGERNHIVTAVPNAFASNGELPNPYLTEIKVLNKPYQGDTAFYYQKTLSLKPEENYFSIGFSAQCFRQGTQTQFKYRLKGLEDWVAAGDRRFANYTNVPSGDYIFQLQAIKPDGTPGHKTLELAIQIATPWWATWWFKVHLIVSVLSLFYAVYQYRLFQVRKEERLKTAFNKKLANVEMTALLAQMNPHFLFNSLNSIDSYILTNKPREASEYLNSFARLMRLILQNSRSNYITLKDELETLKLYIEMESLRLKNKFKYQIEVDEALDISSIDIPPMLIQPYVENAIWHGLMNKQNREEGLLSIALNRSKNMLHCTIRDNGIGRQKALEIQTKRTKTKRKSMGMSITSERIELINQLYNLDAMVKIHDLYNDNKEASGTEVRLDIPI